MNTIELENLASDRDLVTPEIHLANDFYGHAATIKRYLGLDPHYSLKVMIEHGIHLSDYLWDYEVNSDLTTYLCANDYYQGVFQRATGKQVIPIGPQLAYLPLNLRRIPVPQRRTLLVFPYHSTHHITNRVDEDCFLKAVSEYGRRFDRIIVCVYWKNILLGDHRAYLDGGYDCVTAGHIYDPLFVHRLAEIIGSASAIVSANAGTEVLYSVVMNRPAWVIYNQPTCHAGTDEFRRQAGDVFTCDRSQFSRVLREFSEPKPMVTPSQLDLIHELTGFRHIKTVDELSTILRDAERQYAACKLRLRKRRLPIA